MLCGPADFVAGVSLCILAALLGLTTTDFIMPTYLRKRYEIALMFAVASLLRGSECFHLPVLTAGLHVASAVIDALACGVSCLRIWRERHGS
jgi:hypothetical protein